VVAFLFSYSVYCQLQMQIINVSLAKAEFPDKQQNPWHSSQNRIPNIPRFSRKWEPCIYIVCHDSYRTSI